MNDPSENNTHKKRVGTESQPTFRPFNPNAPVTVYYRHLPHWRQQGATYAGVFRQSDSIPAAVLEEWKNLKSQWLAAHGLKLEWQTSDPEKFVATYRNIEKKNRRAFERQQSKMLFEELDRSHGSCVLRHEEPREIISEALTHFHGERLWLGDTVIMPNHVHFIMQPFDDWPLEDLLGSIKKWTSRLIGHWLASQPESTVSPGDRARNRPRFWQQESYDRIIRDVQEWSRWRAYIEENPAVAPCRPGEFLYEKRDWKIT